ncbi:hypothetical protein [Chryseobacterium sp.]|uniref:hypothetical protein n=1 Tax=Chryseobacterium sp. TaxID=1871047 RepID=UPI00388DA34B
MIVLLAHIAFSISITWLTYYFNRYLKFGAVKASSCIALLIGGIFQLNEYYLHFNLDKDIPFIAIGSTFIGMVTSRRHYRHFNFFIAPIIFTLLYHNISKNFDGFGGALGTAACISLVISIYLRSLNATKRVIKPFRRAKIRANLRYKNKQY